MDILKRLHGITDGTPHEDVMRKVADEIKQLHERVKELEEALRHIVNVNHYDFNGHDVAKKVLTMEKQ